MGNPIASDPMDVSVGDIHDQMPNIVVMERIHGEANQFNHVVNLASEDPLMCSDGKTR